MIKSVFVCYCDWCGEEIKAGRKSLDVDGDILNREGRYDS